LDGLKPEPRSDLGEVRRHPELLNEACALRAELPTRSSAQIAAILFARHRIRVAERTNQPAPASAWAPPRGNGGPATCLRPLRGVPPE
jgi:hypothetical protein